MSVRVAIVAEYYPRTTDPVLGVWAHRQAIAARDAGADVRVLLLHRLVPPRSALERRDIRGVLAPLRQPRRTELDGIEIRAVPFVAPPRPTSYPSWSVWAAAPLAAALRLLRRRFPFDLVHAHYAAPGGDAARRAAPGAPLVVSVHGGDVIGMVEGWPGAGARAVERGLRAARLVLANSGAIALRSHALGALRTRVVHLGTDVPPGPAARQPGPPRIASVGHLVARKRHADVLRALWSLRDRHPDVHYTVVGDGPELAPLQALAAQLGLSGRVDFRGQLPHAEAMQAARAADVFVLPSVDEAFGVAYVEAMAAGVPAVGCRGEPGPEEIATVGGGMRLVPPGDPESLAAELRHLLEDSRWRQEQGAAARRTVLRSFTWDRCGRDTVAAYEEALR